MGIRTGKLVVAVLAALAVASGCGAESTAGSGSSGGGSGDGGGEATTETISSADEVIKIVDQGFRNYEPPAPGMVELYVGYGYVVENVSDKVAIGVQFQVDFNDEAGKPVGKSGDAVSVLLPGQKFGVGDLENVEGEAAEMAVRVTMITHLDTPDGQMRKPKADYAELTTTGPETVSGGSGDRRKVTVEVANTYDIPVKPRVTAVVRDAQGTLIGGGASFGERQEFAAGDSGPVEVSVDTRIDDGATGAVEYFTDPQFTAPLTKNPVWQDL